MTTFARDKYHSFLINYEDTVIRSGVESDECSLMSQTIYALLKSQKMYSVLVPQSLGGVGGSIQDLCEFLTEFSKLHASSALAFAMHQHVVAANCFNYLNGKPGEALLTKVLERELCLISTGAGDWLASNGELTKTPEGFRLNATKHFASSSQLGDVLVTSAPYLDPDEGWQVLHFPVSMKTNGVYVLDDWKPMGMRATGSNSVKLVDVLVPEESIALRRARGDFHAMWNVVLPIALTTIMSVYRGIAQKLYDVSKERAKLTDDQINLATLGQLENALTITELAVQEMIKTISNFDFQPSLDLVNKVVKCKTIASKSIKEVADKSIELCGGPGYLTQFGIEALYRDALASQFHPMQEKRQLVFTGALALGQEPPKQTFV